MKILLIKQTSLGDVIHSTLAVEAIVRQWPQAEIHFMVDRACYLAVQHNPHISRFFLYEHQKFRQQLKASKFQIFSVLKQIGGLMRQIRKGKYDLAIDLQGIERSALFLYGARSKQKFIKGRKKPFLKNFRNANRSDHALAELRGTLALAGIDASTDFPKIYPQPEAEQKLQQVLPDELNEVIKNTKQQLILISPFTSWKTKDVPLPAWLQTIKLLAEQHPQRYFAFTATPEHKENLDCAIAKAELPEEIKKRIHNLAGATDIQQLISLIKASDAMMCSEGAAGHISSALNTPVAVVFGPTLPSRVGPWGESARVIQSTSADCLACYKRTCDNWICMNSLESQIATAVEQLLLKN